MSYWPIRYAVYATFAGFILAVQFSPAFKEAVRDVLYAPLITVTVPR